LQTLVVAALRVRYKVQMPGPQVLLVQLSEQFQRQTTLQFQVGVVLEFGGTSQQLRQAVAEEILAWHTVAEGLVAQQLLVLLVILVKVTAVVVQVLP
jgi:hypothetical protein